MDFTKELKQAQIGVYAKAAEEIENQLGDGWKVELSKAARNGKFSIKHPLMTATFGTTKVDIATSERGRQLRILGIIGPNYNTTETLVEAVRTYIGEDSQYLTENASNEQPVRPVAEQTVEEPTPVVDNRHPFLKAMDGPGINDPDHTIESKEAKTNRSIALPTVKPRISLLKSSLAERGINIALLDGLNEKMNEWITSQVLPTEEQWNAVKDATKAILTDVKTMVQPTDMRINAVIQAIEGTAL